MNKESRKSTVLSYREKTGIKVPNELIEYMKKSNEIRTKIIKILNDSPKTVPEISKELGMDASTVFYYVATYVKYGILEPVEKTEDGYYKYKVKVKT